jgi:hypothetical protein
LELLNGLANIRLGRGTVEILEGSVEVALVVPFIKAGNN